MNHCIWFRQDLRTKDNTALLKAQSELKAGHLIALYILTPATWKTHHVAPCKVDFILRHLETLSETLAQYHIPLKLIKVPRFANIPNALTQFCRKHSISTVFANRQLLHDEIARDKRVGDALSKIAVDFSLSDDVTILTPTQTCKANGDPFKVFTPFKRHWFTTVNTALLLPDTRRIKKQSPPPRLKADTIPKTLPGFQQPAFKQDWPVSEKTAITRLNAFCRDKIMDYKTARDFPGLDNTSQLSPYLAAGILSPRQCIAALFQLKSATRISQLTHLAGVSCWIDELVWREFYYAIAALFPNIAKGAAFKPQTEKLKWSNSEKRFQAWCTGHTGFPLVDAAMRQLNQTGWMHNRLRMVTAMFLTKTLFISWRQGEQYFMSHLIDGDFASNNGGWQWSASTGCDAVPYFRIFNPTTQSERFDPEGTFIRHYCPELRDCPNKVIHNPPADLRIALDYPAPIVDYAAMRQKVIAAFKALK